MGSVLEAGMSIKGVKESVRYDHYATDDVKEKPGRWHNEHLHGARCWVSASSTSQVKRLSDLERGLIDTYIRLHLDIKGGVLSTDL